VITVLEKGRDQGCPTLAITNDPGSPLAEAAEYVIDLHAGKEEAVAATKTYTASLAGIGMLAAGLRDHGEMVDQLRAVPGTIEKLIEDISRDLGRVERYRYMEHLAVIGRGYNYATAFEISLKIQELTRIITEPYSSADFLHGPIAMLRQGFPVIVVAPRGEVLEDMRALVRRVADLDAELVAISNDGEILEEASYPMRLPEDLPEWVSPLVSVIPGQLFALELARAKGMDPDHPEGLSKVTKTW
jgi:glucosamine--fructose-6-phosphate aminotransferase (isomerizing)